jgi:hypothetical protein
MRKFRQIRIFSYPSVMNFEGKSESRSQEIYDLYARIIERIYANEPWVPSDRGPDNMSDEPPFGSLQFTFLEVLNALFDLYMYSNKGPITNITNTYDYYSSKYLFCIVFISPLV